MRAPHGVALNNLALYLAATKNYGLILDPKKNKISEVFTYANLLIKLHKTTSPKETSTEKLRTGYKIMYVSFLIIWDSKLQTNILLSTNEAEYMELSQ